MPLLNEYARVPLDQIVVERGDRQRREIDVSDLLESIRRRGVLQPIILHRDMFSPPYKLKIGERRLTASLELGLPDIPARFVEDMTPTELAIIELEENIKRKDLPWQDLVRAVASIHRLFLSADAEWTQAETAEAVALTTGTVSLYLTVNAQMNDAKVAGAGTVREAYNFLSRKTQREAGDAMAELLGIATEPPPSAPTPPSSELGAPRPTVSIAPPDRIINPAESILHESFLQWAPRYSGSKFNLVHCDFPYGIGVFNGTQSGRDTVQIYDDSKDTYLRLLDCFCDNLDRFMSISAHLIFWFSERNRDITLAKFREKAPSIIFYPFPLIWVKSDGVGIASDPRRHPKHTYETALFGVRGNRYILKVINDVYSAPTDKKLHPSAKPLPVLRHFLSMTCDATTTLFDPTCGSAGALAVAEELGAKRVLGMDSDEQTVGTARMHLRQHRVLRMSSKMTKPGAE